MNDATLLQQLAATDAYAPETEMPAAAWTRDATLAEIERLIETRAGEPAGTRLAEQPVDARGRRGLLVAAAAFVIVLIVGIGLFAIVDPPPEPATTTTPPTTTTTVAPTTTEVTTTTQPPASSTTLPAPPPLDEAAMAFFDGMAAEFNVGDLQAAANRVLSAEEFDAPFFTDDDNDMRPILASYVFLWGELESTIAFEECRTSSFGITTCVLVRDSPHNPSFPVPEESVWQIRVDGERLLFMQYRPDRTAPHYEFEEAFEEWLEANDPELYLQYAAVITFSLDPAEGADVIRRAVDLWRSETGR